MDVNPPILITLTAPTCAGKSYLFNYIRDEVKLPCLISTTTRAPRSGEVQGVDYYFISEEESKRIEAANGFAELAIYRGVRYGVTKKEFREKLSKGLAFLIVEPSGIDHYVKPALDVGALHLKYYIHTDPDVRLQRFKQRVLTDVEMAATSDMTRRKMGNHANSMEKVLMGHMDRLVAMMTAELQWGTATNWTRTLFGEKTPEENLKIILRDVDAALNNWAEYNMVKA